MCKPEKIVSLCTFIGIIIGVVILTVISLINLVMAFLYKNECPIENWIWLYNIVTGSAGVFMICSYILAVTFSQICSKRLGWCFFLSAFFILILDLIWIVISLIKIVPLWTQDIVQYINPAVNTYCNSILYKITQALLIISIVCISLIIGNAGITTLVIMKT
jgi:hypothetical protein